MSLPHRRTPRPAGVGEVSEVSMRLGPRTEIEEELTPIAELMRRLGEGAKVKVFRIVEGKDTYSCSMDVDDAFQSEMEEQIASRCGGGNYALKFFHKGKEIKGGYFRFAIDESMTPPKKTAPELKREGIDPATAAGVPPAMMQMLLQMQQQQNQVLNAIASKPQQSMDPVALVLTLASQNQRHTADMIAAFTGAARPGSAAAPVDWKKEVKDTLELARSFGGDAQPKSLTERMLEPGILRMGEVFANKIGEAFVPPTTPAPPTPTATPAPTSSASAAPVQLPTGQPAKPPSGARLLNAEQMTAWMAKKNQKPTQSPPAPRVIDVVPTATTKKT